MKMFTLIILLFSTLAYATDQTTLSRNISQKIQDELKDVPAGKYNLSLIATYFYKLGPDGPNTGLPVFLSALQTYELPKDLQDCNTNPSSLVCAAAAEFIQWHQQVRPAREGTLNLKFVMFEYCQDYFCPFYKDTQISVPVMF